MIEQNTDPRIAGHRPFVVAQDDHQEARSAVQHTSAQQPAVGLVTSVAIASGQRRASYPVVYGQIQLRNDLTAQHVLELTRVCTARSLREEFARALTHEVELALEVEFDDRERTGPGGSTLGGHRRMDCPFEFTQIEGLFEQLQNTATIRLGQQIFRRESGNQNSMQGGIDGLQGLGDVKTVDMVLEHPIGHQHVWAG